MKYYRHKDNYRNHWVITVEKLYRAKSRWHVYIFSEVDTGDLKPHASFEIKTMYGEEPTLTHILSMWTNDIQNIALGFVKYESQRGTSWEGTVAELLKAVG